MQYLSCIRLVWRQAEMPYIYNFSRDACAENAERMTQDYLAAISELEENPELTVDEAAHRHSSYIKWNRELRRI